jgi:hypothetical protein
MVDTVQQFITSSGRTILPLVKKAHDKAYYRDTVDVQYSSPSDFERVQPDLKRVVVIGLTGDGKSFLLNVLGGWRFIKRVMKGGSEYSWEKDEVPTTELIFKPADTATSCTQETSFAKLNWLGDASRPFVAVDTPGYDDTSKSDFVNDEAAQKHIKELVSDFHNKLKALEFVNAILVIHKDPIGNRLNPVMKEVLKMIDAKFGEAGQDVWKHVIVAYTRCNSHEDTWSHNIEQKKRDLQKEIRSANVGCKIDVPIMTLGGADKIDASKNIDSRDDTKQEFDKLWSLVNEKGQISTTNLQPFSGLEEELVNTIRARDDALEKVAALQRLLPTLQLFALACGFLCFRSIFAPYWLGFLLLNMSVTIFDEIAILTGVAYFVGFKQTKHTLMYCFEQLNGPEMVSKCQEKITSAWQSVNPEKNKKD